MTAQQLKNSILQMAVQGKLVPQDPTDEPASVLLERIRAEKEKLIKEGKIKKDKNPSVIFRGSDNLPYEKVGKEVRCIADEIPFEIPESWEWVTLKHIAISELGKTLDKAKNTGELHKYLCSINVYWNKIDLSKVKEARFEPFEHEKYLLQDGDLLICEGGDIGRCAVWELQEEMYYQNALHRVRFFCNINPHFFRILIEYYKARGIIDECSKGVTIKHLVQSALNSIYFPLPPLAEQKRIVTKIEELLPHIEEYGKAESKVSKLNAEFPEQLKKSILQWAIQGKLVPQNPDDEPASVLLERIRAEKAKLIKEGKIKKDKNESIIFRRDNSHYTMLGKNEVCIDNEMPFEIPTSWVWVRLKTVLEKASTGPFGSMLHKSDYVEQGIPLINPADIEAGKISADKIKKVSAATASRLSSYKLCENDVIIGRRGEMGRSAVITKESADWLCGTGCFFVKSRPELLSSEYLVFLLSSPYVKEKLQENSVGTTMANLNHGILGDLLIPLPPLNEQQRVLMQYNLIIKRFFA